MTNDNNEESKRELDAYRAMEMAKNSSIPLQTIFKSTGGYRQSVVDERNGNTSKPTETTKRRKKSK
jgi:hypothetical protein